MGLAIFYHTGFSGAPKWHRGMKRRGRIKREMRGNGRTEGSDAEVRCEINYKYNTI